MKYRFHTCDVFTSTRFGGNQLAVLPDARGLSDRQMQQIAREFNFAESTFVLPPEQGHTRRVRIFTPATEVPFAGHPNVGSAFVLDSIGELGEIGAPLTVTFEEKAGPVPVTIRPRDGALWCELSAPERLTLGSTVSPASLATAVSLAADDVVTSTHPPQVASVGLPFTFAELRDRAALERARVNRPGLESLRAQGVPPDVHLYVRSGDEFDLRARMFAPFDGVPEDPATGSANCALAGVLSHYDGARDGTRSWRIAQGVEMGRPSQIDVFVRKQAGTIERVEISGRCVDVMRGSIAV
jgi:trans-2,3-dihydro-3-hydroxyanthranilate isomerase